MKKIITLIILVLFALSVTAYDLSMIEETFVSGNEITAYVVVGDQGSSSDVLAQLDIITYLSGFTDQPATGVGKLVSDIDNIYEKDIISIGNPCINDITKEIMDYEGECVFTAGLTKFYNKNNKTQLIIYTVSDASIRDAANSITNKEFTGEEQVIEPTLAEAEQIQDVPDVVEPEQSAQDVATQELDSLKSQINVLNSQLTSLEAENSDLETQVAGLNAQVAELSAPQPNMALYLIIVFVVAGLLGAGVTKLSGKKKGLTGEDKIKINTYINDSIRRGYQMPAVQQQLIQQGWTEKQIKEAQQTS
jgi:hypothetical protein